MAALPRKEALGVDTPQQPTCAASKRNMEGHGGRATGAGVTEATDQRFATKSRPQRCRPKRWREQPGWPAESKDGKRKPKCCHPSAAIELGVHRHQPPAAAAPGFLTTVHVHQRHGGMACTTVGTYACFLFFTLFFATIRAIPV